MHWMSCVKASYSIAELIGHHALRPVQFDQLRSLMQYNDRIDVVTVPCVDIWQSRSHHQLRASAVVRSAVSRHAPHYVPPCGSPLSGAAVSRHRVTVCSIEAYLRTQMEKLLLRNLILSVIHAAPANPVVDNSLWMIFNFVIIETQSSTSTGLSITGVFIAKSWLTSKEKR